jgi:hypothetical protein
VVVRSGLVRRGIFGVQPQRQRRRRIAFLEGGEVVGWEQPPSGRAEMPGGRVAFAALVGEGFFEGHRVGEGPRPQLLAMTQRVVVVIRRGTLWVEFDEEPGELLGLSG